MATKKKITRKELKKPDEFVSKTTELFRYMQDNWKFFVSGLLVVFIAAGVGFLWHRHAVKRETAAFTLYHNILLKTRTNGAAARKAKVCADWTLLEKQYPGTPAAVYGLLQEASCFLNHHEYQKCEATIRQLSKDSKTPGIVSFLSRVLEGYALEEKKQYAGAEKVFSGLMGDPNNFLKDTVRYHLFLCQLRQGKKEAAKKTLAGLKIQPKTDFALPVILVKIQKARLGIQE